ncbi:dipeptidase [Cupriavidus basilensis]
MNDFEGGTIGTLKNVGSWLRRVHGDDSLLLVRRAADIEEAKMSGKLGIILHFRGGDALENDINLVDVYKALGVGVIQITYNEKNRIGDGCEERTDAGLSKFGVAVIKRMNEKRVVVDCSHTGYRTTMDAIEHSARPVVITHTGAKALHPSPRNIANDQIKAIASSGGVIGAVAYPPLVSPARNPAMRQYIGHIRYMVDLVGPDHVGLGLDYFSGMRPYMSDAEAFTQYEGFIATGKWSAASYPPPPYIYPEGIETPDQLPNLAATLLEEGFSEEDVSKIMGGNWLRVLRAVWGE